MIFIPASLSGQTTTASLSGIVADTDGAVIPAAKVVVSSKSSKFLRSTTSNGSGVFSYSGLDSGDFILTVTAKGFEKLVVSAIHLNPGDSRSINSIRMKPGNVDMTITVDATGSNEVEDTGERSSLISAKDLEKLSIEGRDVTELLKILPGAAINTGSQANGSASSNSTFDPGTVGFGGAAGSYSVSGSPVNGVAIRSDGANLTDPTSGAGGLQTVNAEATAEVKIQTANFGADSANGPLVINAVGKSGSSSYHGTIYVYGRTTQLNSADSVANFLNVPKPPDRYIYPGGSIGGPIKIPGTSFNRNKKLTFFANGEDYIQRNVYAYNSVSNAVVSSLVPTPAMLKGDFSAFQIAKYLPPGIPVCVPSTTGVVCQKLENLPIDTDPNHYAGAKANFGNVNTVPISDSRGNPISCNGQPGDCLAGRMDPGALAQFSLFPSPNTPNGQTTKDGYNYTHANLVNSDIYQVHGRVDYAQSERQKFFVNFTAENGATTVPQAQGYFASGSSGGVNTPGGTRRTTYTYSGSANWNATFSSTLTNEAFVSSTYSNAIDAAGKPQALFNSAIGYPYTGAYANGTKQFPTLLDYGYNGLPLGIFPDFSFGDLYNRISVPGAGDNLTKLLGRHTAKIGFNVERPVVNQTLQNTGGNPSNGGINNYYTAPTFSLPDPLNPGSANYIHYHTTCYSPGDAFCQLENGHSNYLANYLTGVLSGYTQANSIPRIRLHAWTLSYYFTDDWKIAKNLSITAGVRIDHIGRWNDDHGFGAAVFKPELYSADGLGSATVPLPGFRWHSIDSSVPVGGFATRTFFYQPRFGFKWDVYGTGRTTLSGGWGQYRFRDGQADAINSLIASNGLRYVNIGNPGINPNANNANQQTSSLNQSGLTMAYIQSLNINPSPQSQGSTFLAATNGGYPSTTQTFYGLNQSDDQAPLTTNYNLTVTQQLPGGMVFSIGYVGNNSNYLLNDNGNGPTQANINALPVGALFQPNPNVNSTNYNQTYTPSNLFGVNYNDYRKYKHYSSLQVESHILTANYNSLQATLERTKGALYYRLNYTWSRNMGVKGGYNNGNAGDSFNSRNNYGPLAYDRTHIANAAYNWDLGSRYHGYRVLRPVLNGWQVSGITSLQSGPNLQSTNYTQNFGLNGNIPATSNQNTYAINNVSYLGTPDVSLQPKLICDPRTNLKRRQYMNAACFALPAQGGDNGPFVFPYIHGPAFFQSDLTLVKGFKLHEKQALEFRAAGFNFLNYKLPTFSGKKPGQLSLIYPNATNPDFGFSTLNAGRRVMELSVKYFF